MYMYQHIACLCTGNEGYGVAHVLKKIADSFPGMLFIVQEKGDFYRWLEQNNMRRVLVPELVGFSVKPGQSTLRAFLSLVVLGFKIHKAAKSLSLVLADNGIVVIHSHWLPHHLITGSLSRGTVRKIWHMHGIISEKRWKGLTQSLYSLAADWGADDMICVSHYAARRYILKRTRIHVVYNGADIVQSDMVQRPFTPPFQLIAAGRMVPIKGFHLCLRALASVLQQGYDVHLNICGGPLEGNAYYRELVELAQSLGITANVSFHGIVNDLRRRNEQMHVALLLNTLNEACGIWVQEAMLDGLPVVATRCGGPEELIDDKENGFLVSKTNLDEAVQAITKLLTDPALYQTMSRNAYLKAIAEFDTQAFVKNMKTVYQVPQ